MITLQHNVECLANSVLQFQTTSTFKLSEFDSIDTVSPQSTNSSSLIQQNGLNHRCIIKDDDNRIKNNHSKFVNEMHSVVIDQSNKQQMVMENSNQMTFDEYFSKLIICMLYVFINSFSMLLYFRFTRLMFCLVKI